MAAPAPARIPVIEAPQPKSIPPVRVRPAEPRPMVRSSRWLRIVLTAILALFALDYGISGVLRSGWLNARFTYRLEKAFGRPVEVSHYSFSLLEGPRLEANYITVGEDPRFGSEYFLRADQLAVGLRWSALLRGHVELGTLSFTNPHLNLVRLADGEWTLESWLPRPPGYASAAATALPMSARPERIDISGGRIDYKSGNEKWPFALTDVQGRVEQAAPASWQLDLSAQPFRAAVAVQQAGELRLTGVVGGTSSRLRPANLRLNWNDASISDVLRLARGTDYGIRGLLAFQLTARTEGPGWQYSSRAELSEMHRWDLAPRGDDPTANFRVDARWVPGKGRLELTNAILETPHSNVGATGGVEWKFDARSSRIAVKNTRLRLTSTGVELGDLLAWYRAFHPGVEDQVALAGMAGVDLDVSGWPPRIESGSIATEGATLSGGSLPGRIRLGRAALRFSPGRISISGATIAASDGEDSFRVQGSVDRRARSQSSWRIDGQSRDVRALFETASALGYSLPAGWSLDGPAQFQLEWTGAAWPAVRQTQGNIALEGLRIRAPFLNREITHIRGDVKVSPAETKIRVASADAFATTWSGMIERNRMGGAWIFGLAADSLDAADMDHWLNPQRREGLLDRVFPFLAAAPQPAPVPPWLEGKGTIAVNEFALAPLALRQVRADASVVGRKLKLSNARAKFYGGTLTGSAELELTSQPSYDVKMNFRKVDVSRLTAGTISLAQLFGGTASGELQVAAKGLGRDALMRSLSCHGAAQVRNASYKGLNLGESVRSGEAVAGISKISNASGAFNCKNEHVIFQGVTLTTSHQTLTASGYADFQRRLNLEIRGEPADSATSSAKDAADPPDVFHLRGTLKSPELAARRPGPK